MQKPVVADSYDTPSGLPPVQAASRAPLYGWLVLLAVGPLLLLAFKLAPTLEQHTLHSALAHVLITAGVSVLGIVLALLVLLIAQRLQDARVFLIGMGFLSAASLFLIHSIATPDVLMAGRSLATQWSAVLSLVLASIFFALSGLNLDAATNQRLMRGAAKFTAGFVVCWLLYGWTTLIWMPSVAPPQLAYQQPPSTAGALQPGGPDSGDYGDYGAPMPLASGGGRQAGLALPAASNSDPLAGWGRLVLFGTGLACYGFATARHYRLYRRASSPAGGAIMSGIVLLGEALLTQFFAPLYSASFWLYHVEELVGFGVISYGVLGGYRHGQAGQSLLESLLLPGTRTRIQSDYARAMDSLVDTLARGDQPTSALRRILRAQFAMSESQVQVLERAALAIAQERQQRQQLEQLNATLRQLEQDRDQFMQLLVHDLKNPLTAISGFLAMLRMEPLTPTQLALVDSALRSSKNLSGLISDLLDLGRMEAGKLELEPSLLDPHALLIDCAAEMGAWLVQSNKVLEIDAPADLPPISADARLMRRVLLNLISNAIKHTPPGTHITLRAHLMAADAALVQPPQQPLASAGAAFILEVEDTGPGIPPAFFERIFEKYGRVNGERNGVQDSTGLGLAFCRMAVEKHGGTIIVANAASGGALFRVTLPIIAHQSTPPPG